MRIWRAILTVAAMAAFALLPATAGANDLYTLDADAVSDGHLAEDAAGNAYVGWTSDGVGISPEPVRFCKIAPGGACSPITLPIPGATSLSDSASVAIPVLGPGDTVYVVAPRYGQNDVIFWTSTDGGASFGPGAERNFYSSKTNPTDAFLVGSNFLIGAYNAGLGFSTAEVPGAGGGNLSFTNPGDGGVGGSSMGLDGTNPVIAYWNLSDPYQVLFYRYKGAGSITTESSWEGPQLVSNGYEPSLAGGPAGLFMVSQDYSGASGNPDAINLRRLEGTSFGPPRTLAVDASTSLFIGGAIAQSPSGNRLAVAWPGERSGDGARVMRLFSSADGGATFSESHIANLGSAYSIGPNAELTTNDAGSGWLLFSDETGLRLADLTPIAGPPPPVTPPSKKTPLPSAPLPPIYKGKSKEVVKEVGAFEIVLRLPQSCLQSRQRFFIGVGKRKRRQLSKKLGGEIRFTKIVFIYDGKKLKVKKKKPFRHLVDPGPMSAGSVHSVKARVTMLLEKGDSEKKIKRTIKGTVRACS
jgi:hypothetical protein